ncbi:MAG: CarD family transcriptional regulator [Ruminococcaceae bacterium]|nr:CarD family transcriptional regulator [Oscillospiraceae bacterium]
MFKVGDKVLCPMHGAGYIESITRKETEGGEIDVYFVRLLGGLKLTIPETIADSSHMREIIEKETALSVIEGFEALETDFDDNWSKRYKENIERIKSGDAHEVSRVYKYLCLRNVTKGLSAGERKMYQTARQILLSELSMALDTDKSEIEKRLSDMLRRN